MNITFDTSNPRDVDEAAELIEGLKKLASPIGPSGARELEIDIAGRAWINDGHLFFGEFTKGNKENWYKVTCITDTKGEVCATVESCISWLKKRYHELLEAIIIK